ncbi:MAG TPA: FtsQ-type POTRA domain-containing protein [Aeromicrobium sp.]|nr:FtsQ-type POTRA domain-containing protein [Aeromicrobium sp.]HKY57684.1 FtsQ-type POTRA domain-containing protein [Aeromicrobium sp.]
MSQELFEKRRRAARWRRIRRWLLGIVAVGVIGASVWLIWFSTVLVATDVEVEGMTTLRADAIQDQADVPLGVQLARLDTVTIETRVARMERIDKVDVRRRWPNTVLISVKERVPVGWVESNRAIRYVDRHGIDFRTVTREPENLLEIRIDTVDPLTRQQALEAVARVITHVRSEAPDLYAQISYVEAETQDSVHLRLSGRRTVVWGSAEHNEEKVVVLRPLLKIDAERYDVSAPELPTTKSNEDN